MREAPMDDQPDRTGQPANGQEKARYDRDLYG
jgi:hypothetical protein